MECQPDCDGVEIQEIRISDVNPLNLARPCQHFLLGSLMPSGDIALSAISQSDAMELRQLFPELPKRKTEAQAKLYARCLRSHEGKLLSHWMHRRKLATRQNANAKDDLNNLAISA